MPFPADLVSSLFERWRFADRPVTGSYTVTVRDQGEELTQGVDYTVEEDQIIALTSEAGEPLTVDISKPVDAQVVDLLTNALVTRGPLSAAEVDLHRIQSIYSHELKYWTRRQPVGQVVQPILRGLLAHATLTRDGVLRPDVLLPPTAPSPADGACLEFIGAGSVPLNAPAAVTWTPASSPLTGDDFTLAGWWKVNRMGPQPSTLLGHGVNLMDCTSSSTLGGVVEWYLDIATGVPQMVLGQWDSFTLTKRQTGIGGDLFGHGWRFFAVTHDAAGNLTEFFMGVPGESTLQFLGSADALPLPVPLLQVRVGSGYSRLSFRGSAFEPQVWDAALSFTAVENIFRDQVGSTTARTFYATLAGSSAEALEDQESSTAGVVTGEVLERPDLTVDLRVTPRPFNRRQLVPARRIEVKHSRNWAPLTTEQIAPGLIDSERLAAQREWLSETWTASEVADDYLGAKDVIIECPSDRVGGAAVLRLARYKYAPEREYGLLGPTPGAPLREGLLLEVGDEVRIYGHQDLADGPVYRVVANSRRFEELDCELRLWR